MGSEQVAGEKMDSDLCADLQTVFDYEVAHGNTIVRIDKPAGTDCEYEIVFAEPLKILDASTAAEMSSTLKYWECRDTHYPIEAGYFCAEHRHSIAGPILNRK